MTVLFSLEKGLNVDVRHIGIDSAGTSVYLMARVGQLDRASSCLGVVSPLLDGGQRLVHDVLDEVH